MFTLIGECISSSNKVYCSWDFCDNKEIANQLEDLVLDGVEKVTTLLYGLDNVDNKPIQKKMHIVLLQIGIVLQNVL